MYLFIYLFIHLFIYLFIYSFIYLFIHSFIYLFLSFQDLKINMKLAEIRIFILKFDLQTARPN